MEIKEIEFNKENVGLLPPPKDCCPFCAVKHDLNQPHNADSLYYQMWFRREYGRFPTWKDALAHCPEEIKEFWIKELGEYGIDIERCE